MGPATLESLNYSESTWKYKDIQELTTKLGFIFMQESHERDTVLSTDCPAARH